MSKIYSLTEAHKKKLKPWADKWIANALSTKPMSDKEKAICRKAVKGLYEAAGKTPPPDHRIVFVSSPFILRFAGGFAAAIWHKRKTGFQSAQATDQATRQATDQATAQATYQATRQATDQATRQATDQATRQATDQATAQATAQATYQATRQATDQATRQATDQATRQATDQATYQATRQATDQATRQATDQATRQATDQATDQATYQATAQATAQATDQATAQATEQKNLSWRFPVESMRVLSDALGLGAFGLSCAQSAYSYMWQGGNQWSGWVGFLTFFRHVVKLKLDYSKFDHYEQLSIHSGPRVMHEEFCMISDRPRVLQVNSRNQPHREDGPFQYWQDGSAIFALNGVFVPQWVVETPVNMFTKEMITQEKNADVRREIIRKMGSEQLLKVLDYKVIDKMDGYELINFDIGDGRVRPFLKMINPSDKKLIHVEGVRPEIKTVKEAIVYRNSLTAYEAPQAIS